MPSVVKSILGKVIRVEKGLKATCDDCGWWGVTDGTETATVVRGERFNGRFLSATGFAAVNLPCPDCGCSVQFGLKERVGH